MYLYLCESNCGIARRRFRLNLFSIIYSVADAGCGAVFGGAIPAHLPLSNRPSPKSRTQQNNVSELQQQHQRQHANLNYFESNRLRTTQTHIRMTMWGSSYVGKEMISSKHVTENYIPHIMYALPSVCKWLRLLVDRQFVGGEMKNQVTRFSRSHRTSHTYTHSWKTTHFVRNKIHQN